MYLVSQGGMRKINCRFDALANVGQYGQRRQVDKDFVFSTI